METFYDFGLIDNVRTIVAEDTSTGNMLGYTAWAVEGSDTALYERWVSESTWLD